MHEYTYQLVAGKYIVKTETVTETVSEGTTEVTVYEYNTSEQLERLTNPDGTVYNYIYNSDGKLLSKLTADGKGDRYTYNENGDILTETYEDGSSYTYTYHSAGVVASEVYVEDGVTTTYSYDTDGNLMSETETEGNVTTTHIYTYDDFDNLLTVTKNDVLTEEYTYVHFDTNSDGINDKSAVATESLEDGTVNTYTYCAYNKLSRQTTTKNGKTLAYNYDDEGNLTKVEHNGFSYDYEYDAFGNTKSVKVGNQSIVSYNYLPDKSKVGSVTYGNGDTESYVYDSYGLMSKKTLSGLGSVSYRYDNMGRLVYEKDALSNRCTYYNYDLEGRLVSEQTLDNSKLNTYQAFLFSFANVYDDESRLIRKDIKGNRYALDTYYYYDDESGLLSSVATTIGGSRRFNYTYDDEQRVVTKSMTLNTPYVNSYTYNDESLIATDTVTAKNGTFAYGYTYDDNGNITEITKNGTVQQRYIYDETDQLVREDNRDINKTVVYSYDGYGNILTKTEYAFTLGDLGTATDTITYSYDSAWKDKLTSYDGQSVTYDAIGNPTSYRGATLDWNGRKLMSYTDGDTSISYEYDGNGLRTSKTVNGVRQEYYYDENGQLLYEIKEGVYELYYKYDADGNLFSITRYRYSDGVRHVFYAVTNTRGDVIELRQNTGAIYATYTYDSWGKCISVTNASGAACSVNTVAVQNSVRFRGYVYDWETGLYYLQSRYYDPETGRFLNADDVDFIGYSGEELSYNMFAYCENNAVNCVDVSGYISQRINSNTQDELAIKYLEKFLDYLELNIVERSDIKRDKNYVYYIDVRYIESGGEYKGDILKVRIRFGDKSAWQKSSYWYANFNDFTSNFTDYIGGAMQDVREPDDVYGVAFQFVFWIGLLFGEFIKSSSNKKNYNFVWGENGIDPKNTKSYYLFEGKWNKYSATILYAFSTKTKEVDYIAY